MEGDLERVERVEIDGNPDTERESWMFHFKFCSKEDSSLKTFFPSA